MRTAVTIAWLLHAFLCACPSLCAQSVSGVVNTYFHVTDVNEASNTMTVDNAAGLSAGQRVLIYQAKGAAITTTNTSSFGNISAINSAGAYELNTICGISGNEVRLRDAFANSYSATGLVQLVTMPSYSALVVAGTVTASSWDPSTGKGGIVAMEATGSITLNADIDVSGQGFAGGALVNYPTPTYDCSPLDNINNYFLPLPASGNTTGARKGEGITPYVAGQEYARGKLANGGGGGNNANAGGGGGGNYGAGGQGGQRAGESIGSCHAPYPGLGGAALSAYGYSNIANRIFLGGGGGSGHENNGVGTPGGNGGGIIILSAGSITGGGGKLIASGLSPINPSNSNPSEAEGDGAGGGGGAGVIILDAAVFSGVVTAEAIGGRGANSSNNVNDCTGPGGGGAGGVVWIKGASFPGAVAASVAGGANGVVSSGNTKVSCRGAANTAAPGASGATLSDYTLPVSGGPSCTVLAIEELRYFTATPAGDAILVKWEFAKQRTATLQRSADRVHFTDIAQLTGGPIAYSDPAETLEGDIYYRLRWSGGYSRIVAVNRRSSTTLDLRPNPVTDRPVLTINIERETTASIEIYSAQGRKLLSISARLHRGRNSILLSVGVLPSGSYFLVADIDGRRSVRPFVRGR